jgi:hypothetical protein
MTSRSGPSRPDLLRIYLQDHLAGAMGGLALARRTARSQRSAPYAAELATIAEEIEQDREALVAIMDRVDARPDRLKAVAALAAERLARLKLNGSLLQRSPLSDVVELEGLLLGVRGKLAGWVTLRRLAASDPRLEPARLDELIARAESQATRLEELRLVAVAASFPAPG